MHNNNLNADCQMLELASSVYLAGKFGILLIGLGFAATHGAGALGAVCLAIAGLGKGLEYRLKVNDPSFYLLLACGVLLSVQPLMPLDLKGLTNHLPALPLLALTLFLAFYARKHQWFTEWYGKASAIPQLRRQQGVLWLSILALATVSSLALPATQLALVLFILAIAGMALHGYLQLVGIGEHWKSQPKRMIGEFEFRKIENIESDLMPLYRLYVSELMPSLKEGEHFRQQPLEDMVQAKMQAEKEHWSHIAFYAAYHQGELIGTLSCQFDSANEKLPFEQGHSQPVSLDPIRQFGSIVELGKFCVAERYRMSPEVFGGLLMCATEEAMARDTAFIVLQSVLKSARIYGKMGFVQLTKEPVTNLEHGVKVQLLVKNITSSDNAQNRLMDNIQDYFSQYILSRFVWRQIIRAILLAGTKRKMPNSISTQDLPTLAQFS